jgi:hypothetical protein
MSTFLTGGKFLIYRLRLVDVLHDEDNHSSMAEWKNACVLADLERADGDIQFLQPGYSATLHPSSAHQMPAMSTCRNHLVTAAYHPLCLISLVLHICICLMTACCLL